MGPRVVSLHIYPVKSCAAIDVDQLEIGSRGPIFDRDWMIVDKTTNRFVTQREKASLALIKPQLTRTQLVISVPHAAGASEISLPLEYQPATHLEVQVWADKCRAYEVAPLASEAISDFLQLRVKLVRMAHDFERKLDSKHEHPASHVSFVDQMPMLLMSNDSLTDVNSKISVPVKINRFRPNIVVEGIQPFEEDNWKKIQIGKLDFDVVKACSRCVIINTDQETAIRGIEPLKTLATYRRDSRNKVVIGQYLIHNGQGSISVGDELHIS
jgi:uncharacterized protein YcbX